MNDYNSLEKREIEVILDDSVHVSRMPIKDFKTALNKLEKGAKKEGLKEISASIRIDVGEDDWNESYLIVSGTRLETELEWHKRLQDIKNHSSKILEDAKKVVKTGSYYTKLVKDIDNALSKSSLKCEVCGKPEHQILQKIDWKLPRIICNDCYVKSNEQ